nr:unnamed protein product [Digitaria exilis]
MDKSDHIEYALYQLRAGGPLVAVIRISENYDECYSTDSQGPQFGSDGFLKVDITSVAELYSIKIKRVQ